MQTPSLATITTASLVQLAELEATGRHVLTHDGYARLAAAAWDLHAALYSLQSDGIRGADGVDLAEVENLASLLETLRDEQTGAAA